MIRSLRTTTSHVSFVIFLIPFSSDLFYIISGFSHNVVKRKASKYNSYKNIYYLLHKTVWWFCFTRNLSIWCNFKCNGMAQISKISFRFLLHKHEVGDNHITHQKGKLTSKIKIKYFITFFTRLFGDSVLAEVFPFGPTLNAMEWRISLKSIFGFSCSNKKLETI